jgi:hypothetical protein
MRRPGQRPLVFLLVALCGAAGRPAAQQPVSNEYRLKAAFIFQFPQFVDWPASALEGAEAVRICVARPNPFGSELSQLVRGESLKGRPIEFAEISEPNAVSGCHMLFLGAEAPVRGLLKMASGRPVLTVGEGDRFLDDGGVIALRVVGRRIRFEISDANARASGLRISSQLLGLATAVRGGAP